jgi:citrate lyase gamma subunit
MQHICETIRNTQFSWKTRREDLSVDGKTILKCILKNMVQGTEPDSTGSRELRMGVGVANKGGYS